MDSSCVIGEAASQGQSLLIRPGTQECLVTREEGFSNSQTCLGKGMDWWLSLEGNRGRLARRSSG